MTEFAKESGHFYSRDGNPAYTQTAKAGHERPTTVRDAKKLGLVPSVTTILKCVAAPGLVNWQIDQAIMSALTATRKDDEDDKAFIARIKRDAAEQGKQAAEFGTRVHGAIEAHFRGQWYDPKLALFVAGAVEQVNEHFAGYKWEAERSFATDSYGGKIDLHSEWDEDMGGVVLDFKGKDGDLADLNEVYPENTMQLSAYANGLFGAAPNVTTANIFFSRTHPGIAKTIIHTPEEQAKGWRMFSAALDLWIAQKGYDPREIK